MRLKTCHASFLGKCLLVMMLCGAAATAWARCQILVPTGTQAVTVNGTIDPTEWSDASTLSAFQNGCLAGGVPVDVRAKRDADNIYVAFRITDTTQVGPSDPGERIVIQLSPSNLNGTNLGAGQSYKINVGHRRDQLTLDSDKNFYRSSLTFTCPAGTPLGGMTVPAWQTQAWPAAMDVKIGTVSTSGYSLEFKIPKTAIGITGANPIPPDLAMSFIVIDNRPPPPDNAYASWFPSNLPVEQVAMTGQVINSADPTGSCDTWVQTKEWGLASAAPSGDVRIARTPEWWWSDDIDTFQCPAYSGTGDQYNYYPTKPCRIKVQYWLRNTNNFDERRDVLVLASAHGSGQLQWQKIQFAEQQLIERPATGQSERRKFFVSSTTGGTDLAYLPPSGINAYGHPCVRVYILPPFDAPAFSKQKMRDNTNFTDGELTTIESAYSLDIGKHMAQQNITRSAQPNCPNGSCQTASLGGAQVADSGSVPDVTFGWSMPSFEGLLRSAYAQPTRDRTWLPGRFLERFGRDHVIVQVRAEGHSAAPLPGAAYRITQEIGGVVQLFPVAQLNEKKGLPVQLFVGNTKSTAQTISLVSQVHRPPGVDLPLSIPTQPRTVEPRGSFVVQGQIGTRQTTSCSCGDFKCMFDREKADAGGAVTIAGLLVIGGVGVGGIAFVRRRKPKADKGEERKRQS